MTETLVSTLQECGIALLAAHGRTLEAGGRNGPADWDAIGGIRALLSSDIPLLSNGNVALPKHIDAALAATGADGVMSAEPLLVDPLLFAKWHSRRSRSSNNNNNNNISTSTTASSVVGVNDDDDDDDSIGRQRQRRLPATQSANVAFRECCELQVSVAQRYLRAAIAINAADSNVAMLRDHMTHMLGLRNRSVGAFKRTSPFMMHQLTINNAHSSSKTAILNATTNDELQSAVELLLEHYSSTDDAAVLLLADQLCDCQLSAPSSSSSSSSAKRSKRHRNE